MLGENYEDQPYGAEGCFNKAGKLIWPGVKQNLKEGVRAINNSKKGGNHATQKTALFAWGPNVYPLGGPAAPGPI
jgi:hypothetical protein